MNLLKRITQRTASPTWDDFNSLLGSFGFGGNTYPFMNPMANSSLVMQGSNQVSVNGSFLSYVAEVHQRNGIVAAAVMARSQLLSQLRFQWRNEADGLDAQTFGTSALLPLERPGAGMTRPRLLMHAEQHVSYSGSAFFHLDPVDGDLRLLRPDWTSIIIGSDDGPDCPIDQMDGEVIGYVYRPGGKGKGIIVPMSEVAHWVPEPDPIFPWRGLSWVTSVLQEILIDRQSTDHLSKFFTNAATPQIVFSFDQSVSSPQVREFADFVDLNHGGTANAHKNLYVGGGASATVVGSKLSDLNYADLTGGAETRIATRARVPAAILGIKEGLKGSALNGGNYSAIRRAWSDGWFAPTADGLCAALEQIVPPPNAAVELTYDARRIPFLQQDRADEASMHAANASTMSTLINAGFEPSTVVAAIRTGDMSRLTHTGLVSVQLQPPGTEAPSADPTTAPVADVPAEPKGLTP